MSSSLGDEALNSVADAVCEFPLQMMAVVPGGGPKQLAGRVRLPDALEKVAAIPVGFWFGLRALRNIYRSRESIRGREELVHLYREVTGTDRDQAKADLAAVEDRVWQLAAGSDTELLVRAAARRLVRWVANGRPNDPDILLTEAAYERLMDVQEEATRAGACLRDRTLQEKYRRAWSDALA